MSTAEFDDQAAEIAAHVVDLEFEEQVAAACRGSGNPIALAWLGEALRLTRSTTVVDACRRAGSSMRFVAPVPMIGDRLSALALARFPGLRLPHGLLERINSADDPLQAGLGAVRTMTAELAASAGSPE